MVLRTAQRLHALAVVGTRLVDVLGNRRRSDKTQCLDVGMLQQSIHRDLVALHGTLNTPSGKPACVNSSAMNKLAEGSRSLGFRMKLLPAASATGNIQPAPCKGS